MVYNTNDIYEIMSFEWQTGREIRSSLADHLRLPKRTGLFLHKKGGNRISGPGFYMNLARLEDEGLIESKSVEKQIDEYRVFELHARKLPEGIE